MGLTLAGLIRERARDHGDEPAIVFEGDVTTYADLDRRSNHVVHALRAAGVGRGDRVAIIDRNGPEFFELLFGTAKLGAVLVAVNWRLAPSEMAFIVADATAAVLVVGPEVVDQLDEIGELPLVRLIVGLGHGPGFVAYEDWLADQPDDDPGVATDDEDVVVQMYTSGTTGLPKGALTTNANFAAQLALVSGLVGLAECSTVLTVMPLYHIAGLANALLGLSSGAGDGPVRPALIGNRHTSLWRHRQWWHSVMHRAPTSACRRSRLPRHQTVHWPARVAWQSPGRQTVNWS